METSAVFARPDEFSLLAVSITIAEPAPAPGDPVEVRVQIENRGETRLERVLVSLYAGSSLIHAERTDVGVSSVTQLVAEWTPEATGLSWLTAKARPADAHLQRGRDDAMATAAVVVGRGPARALPTVPVTPAERAVSREPAVERAPIETLEAAPAAVAQGRWLSFGPSVIASELGATGRIHQICIHPQNTKTVYAASGGVSGSGIWKTTDGAATWTPVTDDLGTPNVKALALDPSNPSRLFAATTDGLIRTDNGGDTWSSVVAGNALGIGSSDEVLLVDPRQPARLLLTGRDGVRRSEDSGATWSVVLSAGRPTDLVIEPSEPRRIYAAINNAANPETSGIYESADAGATWRQLRGCPGGQLPMLSGSANIRLTTSGSVVYASIKTDTAWTLYATTGALCTVGGQQERVWEARWRPTGSVGGQPIFRRLWKGIHADPRDPQVVYAQGTDLWFSSDGGDSFERLSGPHVDHQNFAFDPQNSAVVYTVSDGGVYRSNARGATGTWSFVGRGMRNTEFYDLATSATNPRVAIGGTQDNGTVLADAPETGWKHVRGGDGGTVAIDPTDEQVMYSMGQYADSIERSGDGGDNWAAFSQSLPGGECFNLHFQTHPVDTGIVLASCTSLWRRNQNSDWQAIFTPASGGVVRSAVDGRTDGYFAGTNVGEVYGGVGGQDFRLVLPGAFGAGAVRDIVVDPEHRGVLFVAYAGSQQGRVRRAVATTTSAYSVQDITADLPPSLTVNSLAIDRMDRNTIFAGTNRGVYRGRLLGSGNWSWDDYNDGLPYPDVRALETHPVTGVLRAGTYGRGAYEVTTGPPFGSILRATGRVTFLRVHEVGSGFGSGANFLDVELVVKLDGAPEYAFGLKLRPGPQEYAALGALDHFRRSMRQNSVVEVDYRRTGFRSGIIIRTTQGS